MRKLVRETQILCPTRECGTPMRVETPGSETAYWLCCPSCGEYIYFIGSSVTCIRSADWPQDRIEQARAELGEQPLLKKSLSSRRKKLGLHG